MKPIYSSAKEAVAQIEDGATLMVGGFGLSRNSGTTHFSTC